MFRVIDLPPQDHRILAYVMFIHVRKTINDFTYNCFQGSVSKHNLQEISKNIKN